MSATLYRPRNIASTVIHYSATAAIAGISLALGGPVAIAAAIILSGGVSWLVLKQQKDFLENRLVEHPRVHKHSPHLGEMADDLYKRSGLKASEHPIYDFRADRKKSEDKGIIGKALEEAFEAMGDTHNAAALHLGKPVIMISEPLLKLLDDKEEKAVLAHEFAHAAAHHTRIGLPQKLLGGLAVTTNAMTMIGAWWATGWRGMLSGAAASIGTSIAGNLIARKATEDSGIMRTKDDYLELPELAQKKKIKAVIKGVSSAVSVGVLTLFSPAYLTLWVATKALSAANKLVTGAYSRSMEYQADRGAVEFGADPLALVTGLRKIEQVVENSKLEAFDGKLPEKGMLSKAWAEATASHPATEKRVARLIKLAEKQGVAKDVIDRAAFGTVEVSKEHNMPYSVIKELAHGM